MALGGALGSAARYGCGLACAAWGSAPSGVAGFPLATLMVNVVGSGLAGVLLAKMGKEAADHPWRLFLGVGVLGGFTTFSAFSAETLALLQQHRVGVAAVSVGANVVFGLAAAWSGFVLFRA